MIEEGEGARGPAESQRERSPTMREPESVTTALQPSLRVLVIEDDEPVARAYVRGIERAAMQAAWASTGALGMALTDSFRPDIVLVDLHLPDMSGLILISRFVVQRNCGVVVVSGSGEEADRVVCLELGADDYITKPMSMSEMVARIRAVHRRVSQAMLSEQQEIATPETQVLKVGSIRIDVGRRMAYTLDGRRLALTSAEFTALEVLARAAGAPVSRDTLSEAALRRPWRADDRSVDQLVFNLRQKLPPDEDGGALIQSIRGAGYRLRPPESVTPSQAQATLAG